MQGSTTGNEMVDVAGVLIEMIQIYGWIGLAVAGVFLLFGIDRVDAGAKHSNVFRPLLIPGCVVLWPLVLSCWVAAERRRS